MLALRMLKSLNVDLRCSGVKQGAPYWADTNRVVAMTHSIIPFPVEDVLALIYHHTHNRGVIEAAQMNVILAS